ncbi:MAG: tellurite resistance TerB family protein [Cyanobacteriota bacterium]
MPGSMTPEEAFAAVALVAVACDGELDREEAQALRQQLECRSPYRQRSEREMGDLFDRLLTKLRNLGWQELLRQAIPGLSLEQQETALAMAAQLVHCDRMVDAVENELLATMADQLSLPPERSAQILEVITLLNRDSLAG